jgi:hypothetical protein
VNGGAPKTTRTAISAFHSGVARTPAAQVTAISRQEAQRLVDLVRLMALGSATRARRVRVVLNPHSGKRVVSCTQRTAAVISAL